MSTRQEKRFFDLAGQAIVLVNQGKRSQADIAWINKQLQSFKDDATGGIAMLTMSAIRASKVLNIKRAKLGKAVVSRIRCFWTWPFGHVWGTHPSGSSYDRQCAICHTTETRGTYDGDWKYDLTTE